MVYLGPPGIPATDATHAPSTFIAACALDACSADPALTPSRYSRQGGRQSSTSLSGVGHGFNVSGHDERLSISMGRIDPPTG